MRLFKALAQKKRITATDLMILAEVDPTTAYRFLKDAKEAGIVKQTDECSLNKGHPSIIWEYIL